MTDGMNSRMIAPAAIQLGKRKEIENGDTMQKPSSEKNT